MRHVHITIPAYTGWVHMQTMRAIWRDSLLMLKKGYQVTIADETGNACIGDSRAALVANFLQSDGTDLIFVDSDVFWQRGVLMRLLEAPVDCVGAVYPQRVEPGKFVVRWIDDKPTLEASPIHQLVEVNGLPIGCCRFSRSMLQRMVRAHPELEFDCDTAATGKAWGLFDPYREGKKKYSEDFSFFARWRAIGGKVWIEPDALMGHIGNKAFTGSLREWLTTEPKPIEATKSAAA